MIPRRRLIVIGGGAAGFFCAVNAARRCPDLSVVLLEKGHTLLGKVRISGGGRCNVTHACSSISELLEGYPRGARFLKPMLHRFFTTDTIEWFESRGVALKTEADGRMFPVSDQSASIVECLLREAGKYNVDIRLNTGVHQLAPDKGGWRIQTLTGKTEWADYVCVACGGFPKAAQFNWLLTTGHSLVPPVPSLFTFNMPGNPITELMGVSVPEVQVRLAGSKLQSTGPLLITHWGMSGPAILRLSAMAARLLAEQQYTFNLLVNWVPAYHENSMRLYLQSYRLDNGVRMVQHRNPFGLPQRLWDYLLTLAGAPAGQRWAELPAKAQNGLAKLLCGQEFAVSGKTTFKEEFVTAGGITTDEIDAATMESRLCPGLFFAGEIIDVDGITGGYNFQNAWTTGWVAAEGICAKVAATI